MSFPAFDNVMFPPMPRQRYDTMPVFLEPMQGSGERVAVCAGAWANDTVVVTPLVQHDVARCLYGSKAKGFTGLIGLVATSLEAHLSSGGAVTAWRPPIAGVTVGDIRPTFADTPNQAVAAVAALHASLCRLPALAGIEDDTHDEDDSGISAWVRQVQQCVGRRLPQIALNQEASLGDGDQVTLHLVGTGRCALIGMITPERLNYRANDAKIKLWNLEHLSAEFARRELVLGIPREDAPNMADAAVRAKVLGKIEALRAQASASHIALLPANSADEAAEALAA